MENSLESKRSARLTPLPVSGLQSIERRQGGSTLQQPSSCSQSSPAPSLRPSVHACFMHVVYVAESLERYLLRWVGESHFRIGAREVCRHPSHYSRTHSPVGRSASCYFGHASERSPFYDVIQTAAKAAAAQLCKVYARFCTHCKRVFKLLTTTVCAQNHGRRQKRGRKFARETWKIVEDRYPDICHCFNKVVCIG